MTSGSTAQISESMSNWATKLQNQLTEKKPQAKDGTYDEILTVAKGMDL